MLIARVIGTVVASRKHERLVGSKIQIVQPLEPDGETAKGDTLVAVDAVGAGVGELVLLVQGSSARMALDNESAAQADPATAAWLAQARPNRPARVRTPRFSASRAMAGEGSTPRHLQPSFWNCSVRNPSLDPTSRTVSADFKPVLAATEPANSIQ